MRLSRSVAPLNPPACSLPAFASGNRGTDRVVALLIDDQAIVGRAVADMLQPESDVRVVFCQEPSKAVELAATLGPTVILQDLVMPGTDGLSLLKSFRENPVTRDTPIVVLSNKDDPIIKAQSFALGASDYLVKLPHRFELAARIRHHSRSYIARVQRDDAYREMRESRRAMEHEMAQAVRYVSSILPPPISDGPVRIKWRFVPSAQLGGDAFGYVWLDPQCLAIYLLDVAGHGAGASLRAVTALNILSHQTLPQTDFRDPSAVLRGLNTAFSSESQGGSFLTMWYGVYRVTERKLTFSGGGHPPALLFAGPTSSDARLQELRSISPPLGIAKDTHFCNTTMSVPAFGRMLLYSDGAVEVGRPGGDIADQSAFVAFVNEAALHADLLERVFARAQRLRDGEILSDDCSLMQIDFS